MLVPFHAIYEVQWPGFWVVERALHEVSRDALAHEDRGLQVRLLPWGTGYNPDMVKYSFCGRKDEMAGNRYL